MTLKDTIYSDMKQAMKNKNQEVLGVLRMVKAKFIEFETSGQDKSVDDETAVKLLKNLIKQRQDSAKLYQDNNRLELAEKENSEIDILKKYLPEAIGEQTIKSIVDEVISQTGASSAKEMGKVMGATMGKLKSIDGLVDGALVQKIVKDALTS